MDKKQIKIDRRSFIAAIIGLFTAKQATKSDNRLFYANQRYIKPSGILTCNNNFYPSGIEPLFKLNYIRRKYVN